MTDHANEIRDAFLYLQGFDVGGWPAHLRQAEAASRGEEALDALLAGHAAEVERLKEDSELWKLRASGRIDMAITAERERDEARADAETLRQALRKYGWHTSCRYRGSGYPESCNCGFLAALAAAQEPPAVGACRLGDACEPRCPECYGPPAKGDDRDE